MPVEPGALPIASLPCKASVSPVCSLLASPSAGLVSPLGNFIASYAVLDDSTLSFELSDCVADASPATVSCLLCAKAIKTLSILWQHINFAHISRGVYPSLSVFQHYNRLICPNPSCQFG